MRRHALSKIAIQLLASSLLKLLSAHSVIDSFHDELVHGFMIVNVLNSTGEALRNSAGQLSTGHHLT